MIRAFRILIVIVLLVVIATIGKSVYNQTLKFKEITQAESKVSLLEKENHKLESVLEKGKTNFFLEKQARDKLGFQKPGDVLYVVPKKEKSLEKENVSETENWRQWLNLFFH
jgi:cell division protein FtsB